MAYEHSSPQGYLSNLYRLTPAMWCTRCLGSGGAQLTADGCFTSHGCCMTSPVPVSVVVPTYVMVPTAVSVMMTVGGMVLRVSLLLITGGGLAVSVAEEGCLSLCSSSLEGCA